MTYDDTAEAIRMIIQHHRQLLTGSESLALKAVRLESKATSSKSPSLAAELRLRHDRLDPMVRRALDFGPDQTEREIARRVLRDRPEEVDLNRCPECGGFREHPAPSSAPGVSRPGEPVRGKVIKNVAFSRLRLGLA